MSAPVQRVVVRRVRGIRPARPHPQLEPASPPWSGAPAETEAPASELSGLAAPTGILIGVALGGLFWLALFAIVARLGS